MFRIISFNYNNDFRPVCEGCHFTNMWKALGSLGLLRIVFIPPLTTLKTTREESPMPNVHTTRFKNNFVLVS